jgi:hypothetical protein
MERARVGVRTREGTSTHRGAARAPRFGRGTALAAVLAGALILGLGAPPARALTVLPGQAFEVDFSFSSAPQSALGDVDVLAFQLGAGTVATGVTGYQVELYDGAALLGTHTTAALALWSFVSAASPWTVSPLVVDLSSVIDGSIAGRLRVIPSFDPAATSPSLEVVFFPPPGTGLDSGTSLSDGVTLADALPAPTVHATRIAAVPEPGLLGLLAAAGLAVRRLRA